MNQASDKVGVIGGGSFGSAVADIIGNNGRSVLHWHRSAEMAAEVNSLHENRKYLPGFRLSENVAATSDLAEVGRQCRLIFFAVPSPHFREVAHKLGDHLSGSQLLVSMTKGIELDSFKLMSQILREETPCLKVGVLSGPNLAKEIIAKKPSGTVIASQYEEVRNLVQDVLSCPYFRVYSNHDVYGVELAGALKNVYAIATGLSAAMGLGDNTKGMLITRGLIEMSRLAEKLGANPLTFLGLAGVGDLVTTCSSELSRNFRVGFLIGLGRTLKEAVEEIGEVAEGVNTVKIVRKKIAELGIHMHILEGLHALLFENQDVKTVLTGLMNIPQMEDVEFSQGGGDC